MKRQWRERTERLAAELLEIPKDTLEHVPRITMIGNLQIVIDNYRSIVTFEGTAVRIALVKGELAIRGEGLVLKVIVPEQIVIEGNIIGVEFRPA